MRDWDEKCLKKALGVALMAYICIYSNCDTALGNSKKIYLKIYQNLKNLPKKGFKSGVLWLVSIIFDFGLIPAIF